MVSELSHTLLETSDSLLFKTGNCAREFDAYQLERLG